MLFCPSLTRSARFLHTDQFVTRLRRVEVHCNMWPSHTKLHAHANKKRVQERDGVRCSVWRAAIFRTSLIDVRQILHLS